jgi:hypothetical protein
MVSVEFEFADVELPPVVGCWQAKPKHPTSDVKEKVKRAFLFEIFIISSEF